MSTIRYSRQIKGDRQNYHWPVTFDKNGSHLGITQKCNDDIERVLLSRRQVVELLKFLGARR